jgi:hypothetical protein
MNKKELYELYLNKLEETIDNDKFDDIDLILEAIYSENIPEKEMDEMYEVLNEATLYTELRENEYKEAFKELVEEFKK